MTLIRYSIILPTYNRFETGYLQKAIESVLSQEEGEFSYELVVVDDGSSDGTREFLRDIATKDARIKVVTRKNGGPAKAVHDGIAAAAGEYVTIMGDDDLLTRDSLKIRTKYLKTHPELDWFYASANWIDDYGLPMNPLFESRVYEDYHYERMLLSPFMHSGTLVAKRSALLEIVWPEWLNRSEDYFIWLELLRPQRKLKFGYLNEFVYDYRFHTDAYTASIDNLEKKKEKDAINLRIKSLHPASLVFLAEQAYEFSNGTNYLRKLIEQKDQLNETLRHKVKMLEDEIIGYKTSKYIGPVIKLRKLKTHSVRILRRKSGAIKQRFRRKDTASSVPEVRRVKQETWDHNRPLVSVVTPFFNRTNTLPDTIRSVLGQTFQDIEYIIVNDGSTDSAAKEYLKKIVHPRIRVVTQQNQGVAAARNNGIKHAKGKYVMCLDDDDMIHPTFIEKAVTVMESEPKYSIVSYDMQMFGSRSGEYRFPDYDPLELIEENTVITAALFRREAWSKSGGYNTKIGYEDWEFWVKLAENGYLAKQVKEALFKYRTSLQSRYVDDLENHTLNAGSIKALHPKYRNRVAWAISRKTQTQRPDQKSILQNTSRPEQYLKTNTSRPHVLIIMPWMPFGGAEMHTLNFCSQLMSRYSFSFMTTIKAEHEWDFKFQEVSTRVYHLANLFDDEADYYEFIKNYIATRGVDVVHVVHAGYPLSILGALKETFPELKTVVTMFNDRVPEYVEGFKRGAGSIDALTSDNLATIKSLERVSSIKHRTYVIANGVDCENSFNPRLFDRETARKELGVGPKDKAILFVGRFSEEKNPDVFVEVAKKFINSPIGKKSRAVFLMAGGGEMMSLIEKSIEQFGSTKLQYIGYKLPAEIASVLSAADVLILPSKVEGFPVALTEAMAMSVAPIASKVGGVPDLIDHKKNGLTTTPGDEEEILDALEWLLAEETRLQKIKKQARETIAKNYTLTAMADMYDNAYKDLIQ